MLYYNHVDHILDSCFKYLCVLSLLYPFDVGSCQAFAQESCIIKAFPYLYTFLLFFLCPCRWGWIIGQDKKLEMDDCWTAQEQGRNSKKNLGGEPLGGAGNRKPIGLNVLFPSVRFSITKAGVLSDFCVILHCWQIS